MHGISIINRNGSSVEKKMSHSSSMAMAMAVSCSMCACGMAKCNGSWLWHGSCQMLHPAKYLYQLSLCGSSNVWLSMSTCQHVCHAMAWLCWLTAGSLPHVSNVHSPSCACSLLMSMCVMCVKEKKMW